MTAVDLETMRRGACPSLAAPMQTGDGWLSRVAVEAEASPAALIGLCEAALRHGNGLIDISARGNLQARGLPEAATRLFEAEIRRLDLVLRNGIAIDTSPLAGLDPLETADPRPLAEAIRQHAAQSGIAARLAPKTAVIVDGGGAVSLAALLADIRLKAHGADWLLFTGGPERPQAAHGLLSKRDAARIALVLLAAMANAGRRFRGRDFTEDTVRALAGDALRPVAPMSPSEICEPSPVGLHSLKNGLYAIGVAPAFGQVEATRLISLLNQANALGIAAARPAPGHALIAFGTPTACRAFAAEASRTGFITRPDDPRLSIAVCPGKPSCASATIDTRALGTQAAAAATGLLDGSFTLHVSGCAKGCAHPEPALISLSGTPEGTVFIFDGKASDPPNARLAADRAPEALRRLSALVDLQRSTGETAAQCLRRLGPTAMASAFAKGTP